MRFSISSLCLALVACGTPPGAGPVADVSDAAAPTGERRSVILLIGDGMGAGQIDAASLYRHGATGQLDLTSMPVCGKIASASLSGITDSAAAATTMATGARTLNYHVGVDPAGQPLETVVEWANARGIATGVVTTAAVSHATPGSFSAHRVSRNDMENIARDQVRVSPPGVLLGGGAQYFDGELLAELAASDVSVVTDREGLAAAKSERVWGLFADTHMDYVRDRTAKSTQPTLTEMALDALDRLDRDPDGFFLMIEGARIDMASHGNDIDNAIAETLDFDDTVAAVRGWAASRDDVLIMVTADHECGGLEIAVPAAAGTASTVSWRWGNHTNAPVDVCAQGPGAELFAGATLDHRWIYAATLAHLSGDDLRAPESELIPDGRLGDMRYPVAVQQVTTDFGQGFNELSALSVDVDSRGLAIGIEGVFEWDRNAVVVLIDVDYGAQTGVRSPVDDLADIDGRIDGIVSSVPVLAPVGFGAELAVVSWGGQDARLEDLWDDAGLRGLVSPYGSADDLSWRGVVATYGDAVRARVSAIASRDGEGLELFVPFDVMYPGGAGLVPPWARVGIAIVMTNDDGGFLSNQALPPFEVGIESPGRNPTRLPGVVVISIDANGDRLGDGDTEPIVIINQ